MHASERIARHLVPRCFAAATVAIYALSCLTPAIAAADEARIATTSPVVLRLATVGDSRGDPKAHGLDGADRRWVQNTAVLARMLDEISADRAQVLVFNGDMVMGYTRDAVQLEREYAYWRGMVAPLIERGTYLLPVPGNHEMQMPTPQASGKSRKLAQPELVDAWRANMGDLILDTERWQRATGVAPTAWDLANAPAPGSDGISSSQLQLSYSFDSGIVHIAVINTDPVGHDGAAPVEWLKRDFAAARARGAKRFFVFGHKMAYSYAFSQKLANDETGLDERPAERDAFWDLVEAYGATYFCGHEHIFHASQPRADAGGRAWQVLVGSGGSPFAAKPGFAEHPTDRFYAWAEVAVHADGAAEVVVHGFDANLGPTRVLAQWALP